MTIQLSDHFTYKKLFRYVLPSILLMIFTSLYSVVDGFFVSNFVGKTSFAAINLVMPFLMGISTVGFMFGTGGSAIVSMTLGQGKSDLANRYFSLIVYATFILGLVFSLFGIIFTEKVAIFFGATGDLLKECVVYGRIYFIFMPIFMLQVMFQSFFVVAEKPNYSLIVTIVAGVANMILDYVFIALFDWGIAGAAYATGVGICIGGFVPVFYFFRQHNSSPLRLGKTSFYGRILVKSCTNGASEMVSNLSASVVGMLYNFQLMKYAGENGVAAYGVLMYASFTVVAIFTGYTMGSSPIVSYHFGAKNHDELKNMFKKGLFIMSIGSLILVLVCEFFLQPIVAIFTGYDSTLTEMTVSGGRICFLSFLFTGINIWGSGFFTSLNNGLVSGLISVLRTFVFQIIVILILPAIFGLNGIWYAIVLAELLACFVTVIFLVSYRKKYWY